MDKLIDMLLDLIFKGSFEPMPNKNYSKWFRLISIIVIVVIMIGIIVAGLVTLQSTILGGFIIIIVGMVLFVKIVVKIRKRLKKATKN